MTLVVEAGIIQSLSHRARLAAMKRWRGGRRAGRQYRRVAAQEAAATGDVEGAQQLIEGEREDEDVREERLMIDSGTDGCSVSCSRELSRLHCRWPTTGAARGVQQRACSPAIGETMARAGCYALSSRRFLEHRRHRCPGSASCRPPAELSRSHPRAVVPGIMPSWRKMEDRILMP